MRRESSQQPRNRATASNRVPVDPRHPRARKQRPHFRLDVGGRGRQRLDLQLVERDLLLEPAVLELARMRRFARRGGPVVGLRQLEPQPLE